MVADLRKNVGVQGVLADLGLASGGIIGCSVSIAAVFPCEVRNSQPLRSSAMPTAVMELGSASASA